MVEFVVIVLEDDPTEPVYAEPGVEDVDEEVTEALFVAISLAFEGDGRSEGTRQQGELMIGWKVLVRSGVAFAAAVTDDVSGAQLARYLKLLSDAYMDEVDDPREPEPEGLQDVVADVIPPWEDEDE